MDTVRFGRALGFGARSAAKTLIEAVGAASAEGPKRDGAPNLPATGTSSATSSVSSPTNAPRVRKGSPQRRGPLEGARRFRDSAVRPFIRLSGVLLLEVVGVFFAVFALYGFNTLWRTRAAWHAGSPNHRQFLGGVLVVAVFSYFCISSFVRARRRERRR